jgi:hypothetical protein
VIGPDRYVRTPRGVGKVTRLLSPEQAEVYLFALNLDTRQWRAQIPIEYPVDELTDLGASVIRAKIEAALDRYEQLREDKELSRTLTESAMLLDELIADMRILAMEAT